MFDRLRLFPSLAAAALLLFAVKATGLYFSVVAEASEAPAEASATVPETTAASGGEPEPAHAEDEEETTDLYSQEELRLLQELSERRKDLDKRADELEMREQVLKIAETRVDEKLSKLKALETEIKALFKVQEEKENAQIDSLVKVYETMKPKDAARIFDTLGLDILIQVTERMSERKIAPIMASMSPEAAKALTVELATRVRPEKNPG